MRLQQVRRTPLLKINRKNPKYYGDGRKCDGKSENSVSSQIHLKAESLQSFGSYKIRGVNAFFGAIGLRDLKHGVVGVSAGNLAQPIASVARDLGIEAKIFVPDTAPEAKKAAIRSLGAVLVERPFAEIWDMVLRGTLENENGLFIHPTRTPLLITGYADIVEEILADQPDTDAIVVPFGLGGLTLGILTGIRRSNKKIAVFTAEPETAAPLAASLSAGKPMKVDRKPSFVDAIGTPEVLPDVFDLVKDEITGAHVVPLKEIEEALRECLVGHKLLVEGAAAAALAAAKKVADRGVYEHVVAILSGGNMNQLELQRILGG
ncbi:MAG: pyridoxal-phosphate dependent enzyme [Proteobacteria bacterium]|nr:pyridoxal-phosphate dependent enzyme [Pseudomonadota bacterium]